MRQIGLPNAATSLGLGGALNQQAADQTEELRKKKMREQQGLASMSPAAMSLLGGSYGGGY